MTIFRMRSINVPAIVVAGVHLVTLVVVACSSNSPFENAGAYGYGPDEGVFPGASSSGGTDASSSGTTSSGGSTEIYCMPIGTDRCTCGHNADYGGFGDLHCSTESLGRGAFCCAGPGWPKTSTCHCEVPCTPSPICTAEDRQCSPGSTPVTSCH